ncbi:Uncharacterised protein [Mycobacteroides abscessus subsp. massiliense]|nr:Uncharacterised protein [Mycobacteroides abscessus subsp. massiliense]
MRRLGRLGGQRLVVEFASGVRVQREIELILPAELEARLGQGIVAELCPRVPLGEIGGVSGDLVGDHTVLDVLAIRQAQVLLGGDVAQHRGPGLGDDGRADCRGDVVIRRSDIGGQRAQGVERGLFAEFFLELHVLDDLVHRYVAGAFDHHLHTMGFRDLGELTEGAQLGELRLVVGVGDGSGAQAVAEREGHVVARQDLAQFLEVGVQE